MRVALAVLTLFALGAGILLLFRSDPGRRMDERRPEPARLERDHRGEPAWDANSLEHLAKSVDELRAAVERLDRRLASSLDAPETRRASDALVAERGAPGPAPAQPARTELQEARARPTRSAGRESRRCAASPSSR
jgi:hypothetical protein